jgi:intergrase/recombinase
LETARDLVDEYTCKVSEPENWDFERVSNIVESSSISRWVQESRETKRNFVFNMQLQYTREGSNKTKAKVYARTSSEL